VEPALSVGANRPHSTRTKEVSTKEVSANRLHGASMDPGRKAEGLSLIDGTFIRSEYWRVAGYGQVARSGRASCAMQIAL
jgi:hypothetical protein